MNILSYILRELGFESAKELCVQVFSLKFKFLYLSAMTFGGVISAMHSFTDLYIYSPATGIFMLWIVSFLDLLLGMSVAVSKREGISPTRISRAFIRAAVQTVLVAMLFHMSNTWGYLIASWIVDSLLIVFTLSVFYSAISNAYALNLITKDQYEFIDGVVNVKRWMSVFKKRKQDEEK